MEKTITILVIFIIGLSNSYSQTNIGNNNEKTNISEDISKTTKTKLSRFAYILGAGASYIPSENYQNPSLNPTNNNVIIEKSQNIKTSLTFGITYTPYFSGDIPNGEGGYEKVPRGITFTTFINPLTLSKATENQSAFSVTDFGIGIGYKFAGNIMIMGTIEWFGARQPKSWFINEYKNNDKQYIVNNETQLSFDPKDDNIFYTKVLSSYGFKICYTFDIIKKFKTE